MSIIFFIPRYNSLELRTQKKKFYIQKFVAFFSKRKIEHDNTTKHAKRKIRFSDLKKDRNVRELHK
jgi:hypothetical protein